MRYRAPFLSRNLHMQKKSSIFAKILIKPYNESSTDFDWRYHFDGS